MFGNLLTSSEDVKEKDVLLSNLLSADVLN